MIRHQVYFDTLGSLQEGSASWRSVFEGLSVLRLVDSYDPTGPTTSPANWAQLHAVRTAIEEMSEGDAVRGVLTCVLEEITTRSKVDDTVCAALMVRHHRAQVKRPRAGCVKERREVVRSGFTKRATSGLPAFQSRPRGPYNQPGSHGRGESGVLARQIPDSSS